MRGAAPLEMSRTARQFPRGCRRRRTAQHRSPPMRATLHSRVAVYRHTYTRPRYLTSFGGNVIPGLRRFAAVSTAVLLLSACGSSGAPSLDAVKLLKTAKGVLDGASSFHWLLTSADVTGPAAE